MIVFVVVVVHVVVLFRAVCASLVLRQVKRPMASFLLHMGTVVPYRAKISINLVLWTIYTVSINSLYDALWASSSLGERVVLVSFAVLLGILVLLPWVLSTGRYLRYFAGFLSNRVRSRAADTLATLLLLSVVLIFSSAGSLFVLKTTYEETIIVGRLVRTVVDNYIERARQVSPIVCVCEGDYAQAICRLLQM